VVLQVSGRCAYDYAHAGNFAGNQARINARADPNGKIEAFFDQINDSVIQGEIHVQQRITLQVFGHGAAHLQNPERHGGRDVPRGTDA
jgi:hypothetical protein